MGCTASLVASSAAESVTPVTTDGRGYASPEPDILRAQALNQQGLANDALQLLDSCLARWPECARAYAERGRLRADAGQPSVACADFSAALKLQPDLLMALVGRSRAHLALGMLSDAARDYAKAAALDPDSGQLRMLKEEIRRAKDDGSSARGRGVSVVVGDGAPCARPSSAASTDDDAFAGLDTPVTARASQKVCMVCMDKERGCRLRPCLHAALCVDCAEDLLARRFSCPICGVRIASVEPGSFADTFTTDDAAAVANLVAGPLRGAAAALAPSQLPQLPEDAEALLGTRSQEMAAGGALAAAVRAAAAGADSVGVGASGTPRSSRHTDAQEHPGAETQLSATGIGTHVSSNARASHPDEQHAGPRHADAAGPAFSEELEGASSAEPASGVTVGRLSDANPGVRGDETSGDGDGAAAQLALQGDARGSRPEPSAAASTAV